MRCLRSPTADVPSHTSGAAMGPGLRENARTPLSDSCIAANASYSITSALGYLLFVVAVLHVFVHLDDSTKKVEDCLYKSRGGSSVNCAPVR